MMSDSNKAVFLSYASQDAEAARRICAALRAAGVEVWFDQNELVGGDAWDAKIRGQVKTCALFVPMISANTQARLEGYFRLEWKLAAQRTHTMADAKPFLLPVVIDDTRDPEAHVPEEFRAVQWTRLVGGETPARFCERVKQLLGRSAIEPGRPRPGERGPFEGLRVQDEGAASPISAPLKAGRRVPAAAWVAVVAVVVGSALFFTLRPAPNASAGTRPPALSQPAVSSANRSNSSNGSNPSNGPNAEKTTGAQPAASEARKLVLQARALIDDDWLAVRENFRLAAEQCERATKLDPNDGEAWATWARVSLETLKRKYDLSPQLQEAARQQTERAIRLAPESIEAGLATAINLTRNNQRADAQRRLRDLIARAPLDARVAMELAATLRLSTETRAEGDDIRLTHPAFAGRDPRPLALAAVSLYGARRWGEAEAMFERAAALAPCYDRFTSELAYLIYAAGDLPAATKLLAQTPSTVMREDVFVGLEAVLHLRLGDGEKAQAALGRTPRDYFGEIWFTHPKGYYAGWAARLAGKPAAAQAQWREALSVVEKRLAAEPNDASLLGGKSALLALTGQPEVAEKTWQLTAELSAQPREWKIAHHAEILCAQERFEDAIRELESGFNPIRNSNHSMIALNYVRYEPWAQPLRRDARVVKMIAEAEAKIAEWRKRPEPRPEQTK
jgi:Flp pilus assembly protein TadD